VAKIRRVKARGFRGANNGVHPAAATACEPARIASGGRAACIAHPQSGRTEFGRIGRCEIRRSTSRIQRLSQLPLISPPAKAHLCGNFRLH
jgi:hypothetical protein